MLRKLSPGKLSRVYSLDNIYTHWIYIKLSNGIWNSIGFDFNFLDMLTISIFEVERFLLVRRSRALVQRFWLNYRSVCSKYGKIVELLAQILQVIHEKHAQQSQSRYFSARERNYSAKWRVFFYTETKTRVRKQ